MITCIGEAMINYITEIAEVTALPLSEIKSMTSYSVVGGVIANVNNYNKILLYSSNKILLKVKDNELNIDGKDLTIKQMTKNDITIMGQISSIYYSYEVK